MTLVKHVKLSSGGYSFVCPGTLKKIDMLGVHQACCLSGFCKLTQISVKVYEASDETLFRMKLVTSTCVCIMENKSHGEC